MKPVIGITPSLQPDERQCYLWDAYVDGIVRAGGIPLILPCISDPESVQRYVEMIDGLLLSGGTDIEPIQYGEESLDGFEIEWPMTPARDVYEIELIRAVEIENKPILGICRGHQLLNVAFGGTLYQDLNVQLPREPKLRHFQASPWPAPSHRVQLLPDSKLAEIMGATMLLVNTLHHQAVKEPGNGITISGRTLDGVAESLERPQNRFVVGVQWHPELMATEDPFWIRIFSALIEASSHKD
ncbi:MAG: gamma-glutamyl-gamma-aminobutyrate hydrolase family protein [Negativicutes bacterium]